MSYINTHSPAKILEQIVSGPQFVPSKQNLVVVFVGIIVAFSWQATKITMTCAILANAVQASILYSREIQWKMQVQPSFKPDSVISCAKNTRLFQAKWISKQLSNIYKHWSTEHIEQDLQHRSKVESQALWLC